ncbi:NUMOD4 domain-containing protein [Synechococcus phage MA10]
MTNEIWKPVKGLESQYSVSNLGNIRSEKLNRNLKLQDASNGYKSITLFHHKGKYVTERIHRLVAEAFCDRIEGQDVVLHLDNDKTNNQATNLKWGTQRDNIKQCYREGRMVAPKRAPLYYVMVNPEGETVTIENMRQFCRDTGLTRRCLIDVAHGKAKHHKGWTGTTCALY